MDEQTVNKNIGTNGSISKIMEDEENVKKHNDVVYAIVYKKSISEDGKQLLKLEAFLSSLEERGFELETVPFSENDNILFITIRAPTEVYISQAKKYGIELDFENTNYRPPYPKPYKFMATPLTVPDPTFEDYERAPETFSGEYPKTITNAEKIMVLHKVLSKAQFGLRWDERGIERLKTEGVISDHYALHDGPTRWTSSGPLCDRQILKRYWSSVKYYYKTPPLQLIQRYLGTELAFFYCYYEFYIKMLIPVSIISILFFVGGVIRAILGSYRTHDVCTSKHILCPSCDFRKCRYKHLNEFCMAAYVTAFFDNELTMTFAVIMSIWAMVLLQLWRRNEAIHRLQWNVHNVEVDTTMRRQYEVQPFSQKINPITEQLEPKVPKKVTCFRYIATISLCILLVLVVLLVIIGVMMYRRLFVFVLAAKENKMSYGHLNLLAGLTGGLFSAIFVVLFEMAYLYICTWLTDLENPRTQEEYDNSFIFKMYILAFVNNYSVVFYIAFAKYRFYTFPGDQKLLTFFGVAIISDTCAPAGCIFDLTLQLLLIMTVKKVPAIVRTLILPRLRIIFKKKIRKVTVSEHAPQWEQDYILLHPEKHYQTAEYIELLIQYGFVTFFVCAFPLAPPLALLFSLSDYRFNAFKLLTNFRRPIPALTNGLGVWNDLLHYATYLGVATNAFVLAFTSDFVWREVYRIYVAASLKGFVNYRMSKFKIMDFFTQHNISYEAKYNPYNLTNCYYMGYRHPPGHKLQYQLRNHFFLGLTSQFVTVVVFEHLITLLCVVLVWCIPDIPRSVKVFVLDQREKQHAIRSQALGESYYQTLKSKLAQFRTYSYLS